MQTNTPDLLLPEQNTKAFNWNHMKLQTLNFWATIMTVSYSSA